MFTIRRELYEAYSEAMRQVFVDDLLKKVSTKYSVKFEQRSHEENRDLIEDLIEWAITNEIDDEADVECLVYLNYSKWIDNSENNHRLEEVVESRLTIEKKMIFIKTNI